jgi:hypothetical protein
MWLQTLHWSVVLLGVYGFLFHARRGLGTLQRDFIAVTLAYIVLCTGVQVVTITATRFRLFMDPWIILMAAVFYASWLRALAPARAAAPGRVYEDAAPPAYSTSSILRVATPPSARRR